MALVLAAIGSVRCPPARAADADRPASAAIWGPWQSAHLLADQGKYSDAAQTLKQWAAAPDAFGGSRALEARYYYDLGTLSLRQGQVGLALAYLEKSNRLDPHHAEIQHNLELAMAGARQTLGGEDRLDPASTGFEILADKLSLDEVRATLGLMLFILCLVWSRALWRARRVGRALLQPASMLATAAFLVTLGLYAAQRFVSAQPPAIAIDALTVRSGPGDHFLELSRLQAGVKVRALGVAPGAVPAGAAGEIWRQIRFTADGLGWVRDEGLLPL